VTFTFISPINVTDRNQTYEVSDVCVESVRFQFSRKSFQWRRRYSRKGTLFSKQIGLKYRQKATNLRRIGLHAWKVGQFQEIYPMEAEIKNEKVLCSSSKVLLVIDRLQRNKHFFSANPWTVRGVKFQELRFSGCRNATEKVIRSRSKVTLIADQSQRRLQSFCLYVVSATYELPGNSLP
jgi:hypothetical protein